MRKIRIVALAALLTASCAALTTGQGNAEEPFPARTVKIVIPSLPGSTTDTLARIVTDQLSQKWGKPVVVENIPGGSMNIGAERVARSVPDGYTLFVAPPAPISFNHLLFRDLTYDPAQFAPIALLAKIANVLVVRKDLAATSIRELVDQARSNPGKLTYASQGAGSTAHLSASQLEMLAGIKLVHVPYRGAVPALNDVVAGHVDMFFDTLTTSVPLYRGDKVKILGVADAERASAVPEIPTIAESGLPGFRSITWFGLVAPPGTPAALTEKINRDVVELLRKPDIDAKLRDLRLEPSAGTPAEAARFFADEALLWGKVIKEANIALQ